MVSTLASLQLALKGLVVLSSELEAMGNAVYDGKVPIPWSSKGYPSLKPLPLWYADLLRRLDFMEGWIQNGTPDVIWISVFFFPQGSPRQRPNRLEIAIETAQRLLWWTRRASMS